MSTTSTTKKPPKSRIKEKPPSTTTTSSSSSSPPPPTFPSTTEAPTSLSEHFHTTLSSISSTSTTVPTKLEIVNRYNNLFSESNYQNDSSSSSSKKSKDNTENNKKSMHGLVDAYFNLLPSTYTNQKTDKKKLEGGGLKLPPLEWNNHFRKGYGMAMWVRAAVCRDDSCSCCSSSRERKTSGGGKEEEEEEEDEKRILYRFSTHSNDLHSYGVCATLSPWTTTTSDDDDSNDTISATLTVYTLPSTTTTTSPQRRSKQKISNHHHHHHHNNTHASSISSTLTLPLNTWVLITTSHTFPYLKRPRICISVNGGEVLRGELGYPVLNMTDGLVSERVAGSSSVGGSFASKSSSSSREDGVMNECTILHNLFSSSSSSLPPIHTHVSSVAIYPEPIPNPVSYLAAESGPTRTIHSSMILHPSPPVPQCRDAVVHEYNYFTKKKSGGGGGAGAGDHRTTNGGGRGLGVPTTVGIMSSNSTTNSTTTTTEGSGYVAATALQRLMSRAILLFNALDALTFSTKSIDNRTEEHILCPPSSASFSIGSTDSVPKIGIVQPRPPLPRNTATTRQNNSNSNTRGSLRTIGNAFYRNYTVEYVQSQKLLTSFYPSSKSSTLPPPAQLTKTSLTLTYQSINPHSFALLPFHLSLPPPGHVHSLQRQLYHESFVHLEALLRHDGELASKLLRLIATNLRLGSSMRDEALQNGVLTVVGTLVRKVLVRGYTLGLVWKQQQQHEDTKDATSTTTTKQQRNIAKTIMKNILTKRVREEDLFRKGGGEEEKEKRVSPPIIPKKIVYAIVDIIDAACGPIASSSSSSFGGEGGKWKDPSLEIRKSCDLALTAIFTLGFDLDLWGGDLEGASVIMGCIADRYCGGSGGGGEKKEKGEEEVVVVEEGYGWLLRDQISIQHFLDCVRLQFGNVRVVAGTNKEEKSSEKNGNSTALSTVDSSTASSSSSSSSFSSNSNTGLVPPPPPPSPTSILSLANSLSKILTSMLLYSLSSSSTTKSSVLLSRGETDVAALVSGLVTTLMDDSSFSGTTPSATTGGNKGGNNNNNNKKKKKTSGDLGSITCHIILKSLVAVLVHCQIFPPLLLMESSSSQPLKMEENTSKDNAATTAQTTKEVDNTSTTSHSSTSSPSRKSNNKKKSSSSSTTTTASLDKNKRQLYYEISTKLGRNLIMGQFHDVVAPMLLSRTVSFYGNGITNDGDSNNGGGEIMKGGGGKEDEKEQGLDWRYHWRLALLLFSWLASIAGSEGEHASKSTGKLLFNSGKTGSLYGCLLGMDSNHSTSAEIISVYVKTLVIPSQNTLVPSSGNNANAESGTSSYTELLIHRLRIIQHILPGLVASLVSCPPTTSTGHSTKSNNDDSTSNNNSKSKRFLVSRASANVLKQIMTWVGLAFRRLYGNDSASRKKSGRKASAPFHVKASKEHLPSLLHVAVLLDGPIRDCVACLDETIINSTVKDEGGDITASTASTTTLSHSLAVSDGDANNTTAAATTTDDTPITKTKKVGRTVQEEGENKSQQSQQRQRKRADSDVDWVNVSSSTVDDTLSNQSRQQTTPILHSPSVSSIGGSLHDVCPSSTSDSLPNESMDERLNILKDLTSCRNIALHTASMLILNAMTMGGGEASTTVWRTVVSSLADCCSPDESSSSSVGDPSQKKSEGMDVVKNESKQKEEPMDESGGEGDPKNESGAEGDEGQKEKERASELEGDDELKASRSTDGDEALSKQPKVAGTPDTTLALSSDASKDAGAGRTSFGEGMANLMLCHISALVLSKIARRNQDSSSGKCLIPLSLNLCAATARLCDLVEEKELLHTPVDICPPLNLDSNQRGTPEDTSGNRIDEEDNNSSCEPLIDTKSGYPVSQNVIKKHSVDQARLLCAMVQIMASGRETMGWQQVTEESGSQSSPNAGATGGTLKIEEEGVEKKSESVVSEKKLGASSTDDKSDDMIAEATKSLQTKMSQFVEGSLFQHSYELYSHLSDMQQSQEINYDERPIKTEISPATSTITQKKAEGGNSSPSASKLLLPILQPCLRTVLTSLSFIRSDSLVVPSVEPNSANKDEGSLQNGSMKLGSTKSLLLQEVIVELKFTLKAAIVGLPFPNARDVFLNALASLRRAVVYHRNAYDERAAELCSDLILTTLGYMRARYVDERKRRDKAMFEAYKDDSDKKSDDGKTNEPSMASKSSAPSSQAQREHRKVAESSHAVERLLLGDPVVPADEGTPGNSVNESSKDPSAKQPVPAKKADISESGAKQQPDADSSGHSDIPPSSKVRNHSNTNASDDFIMFPQDAMSHRAVSGASAKENSQLSALGWSSYKGLAAALERCCELAQSSQAESGALSKDNALPTTAANQVAGPPMSEKELVSQKAEKALLILRPYLDTWDDNVARDAAESELVELFDENVNLGTPSGNAVGPDVQKGKVIMGWDSNHHSPSRHGNGGRSKFIGSETAADTMTSYIELSTSETSRLLEVRSTFLTSLRFSRISYVSRYCWKFWMECNGDKSATLWERCISDGGRDLSGRMATVPISPQFVRFIPKYLDHSPSVSKISLSRHESFSETNDDASNIDEPPHLERNVGDLEMELATNNLLRASHLTIVDITKKEARDDLSDVDTTKENNGSADGECGESTNLQSDNKKSFVHDEDEDDDEEGSLGFPEKPLEKDHSDNMDVEADSTTEITAQSTTASAQEETLDQSTSSNIDTKYSSDKKEQSFDNVNQHHRVITSSFSFPPDSGSSIFGPYHRSGDGGISAGGGHGVVEIYYDNCVHVKAEGIRKCALLLTATHLILEFEHGGMFEGETIALEESRRRSKEEIEDESDRKSKSKSESGKSFSTEDAYNPRSKENIEKMERYHQENAAQRPTSLRWNISELSHIYLRRYRLRDSALELFFIPSAGSGTGGTGLFLGSTSLFLDFGPGYEGNIRRDSAANAIMKRAPVQTVKQWPEKSGQFLHEQLSRLTMGWVQGRISNFDYLLHLNCLAGRSYNDLCQYPVMPWVLSNYTSETIPDLSDRKNFRDLTKPMGALNPSRLEEFIERFETFQDPTIPPFMYGSHYSTSAGVVLHFLVRLHPYASLHRQLQSGHFDVADRLFSSVPRTWDICTGTSAAEVKELTPEWYCNPAFLKNSNNFNLGTSQEGEILGDVILPPWADGSPEKFIEVMRCALESDICSEMLPHWIDLIFGRKQQGPESVTAHNVFFYLTYYGSVDVASIEDEALRTATELQIAHFGQCPMQLFWRQHVHKLPRGNRRRRLTLTQMLNLYHLDAQGSAENVSLEVSDTDVQGNNSAEESSTTDDDKMYLNALPFLNAPISHWVHLGAPPPGPHAPMISVRLAGTDRCLCIDAQGIFHSFRWAWKPEELAPLDSEANEIKGLADDEKVESDDLFSVKDSIHKDRGCFIAQRELPHFKSIPRLPYAPQSTGDKRSAASVETMVVASISKTLFASRSLLLVLSDGDGMGALAMQLVDPAKGIVKGEVIIPSVHSARISAIAMDPIGTAAGHGGVGGELAAVGAADGSMTLWRFISSHYWPLRPRLRMGGHGGRKIHSVAINSALNVCASISDRKCCIFDITNGAIIRSFNPPGDVEIPDPQGAKSKLKGMQIHTVFADSPALCLTAQGFVVLVCKNTCFSTSETERSAIVAISLHLFSLEGTHIGYKVLEDGRGLPNKILATSDGRGVMVCGGGGISIHQVSSVQPLKFIDEWRVEKGKDTGSNSIAAYDIDFGPTLTKPVVAAAGCSHGALQLHALQGISAWSEENKKGSMSVAVGNALAKPAQAVKNAVGSVKGIGSRVVGFGKDIGREAMSDVKERGVFRRLFSSSG